MMKKLLLALGFVLSLCVSVQSQPTVIGPANAILCNKTANFTGTAAAAQIVAGVTGQIVAICGWSVTNTAAAGTVVFNTGTGSNCGTNTAAISPTISVSTNSVTDHSTFASQNVVAGNAICQTATATITGVLYYSQF